MTGIDSEPTLVFLPGSLCDQRLFRHQIDHLSRSHPVAVADFSGLNSIEDMAGRVLDEIAGAFVPVGLSLGGIVAAELLRRDPGRIPAAVILDTNLDVPGQAQLDARHRWANQTRAGQFADVVQEIVPSLTAELSRVGRLAAEMALDAGPIRFLAENAALVKRDRDRRPDVVDFDGPVLVVVGEDDRLCPPAIHRALADDTADASLVVVPGAGHLSSLDRPERVTTAIASWLATLR